MSETLFRQQKAHLDTLLSAYRSLMAQYDYDAIALYSGHATPHYGDDQMPTFQAFGHFVHWVPLWQAEHSWLVIHPDQRPTLYLYAPTDFWHLPTALPQEPWVGEFEVKLCTDVTMPALGERSAIVGDINALRESGAALPQGQPNPETLVHALDELRMIKSDYEITCLREANRLAMAGHEAAHAAFAGASCELDIQLAYLAASRQRESHVPYANIIGMNQHAGVLHYQHYDVRAPRQRFSLLVDAGRRFRGYSADITRTHVGPDAPALFETLIGALHGVKDRLIARLAPGVDFVTLHEQMHHELAEVLIDHDLFSGSREQAIAEGVTRAFCPHGLGHSLGIHVHDVAGLRTASGEPSPAPEAHPALRLTRTLMPGMVVTIEPGLYFIPMLLMPLRNTSLPINWTRVDQLAPCGGIRIEDNVVITPDGFDNLTP
ncbi:Xaa-Pro dipeptidase [Vreelandella massiliensis]|uniref:Xaa-Pro dipeptidase n=1 Tax=Vreelandella massiliensis TaxID=1816686 RepID=UPI00096A30F7|nr:Xaa-Pro dipeptidase [Halomonas massiliensis]